jgi:hypothetical protein
MKIKDLYEYNPIVLDYIKNQDFLELKLSDNYKIPLEKLAKYYSVNLDTNQNRYDQAFDICRKILGYDTKLNDITSRSISYLTSKLILPNKLIELYLDKYKIAYKLNNYKDIDVNHFLDYISNALEISKVFVKLTMIRLDIIK